MEYLEEKPKRRCKHIMATYNGTTLSIDIPLAAGAVLDSYDISSIVPGGARGITAENGTDEKFIVMNYDMVYDGKPTYKFNVVQ